MEKTNVHIYPHAIVDSSIRDYVKKVSTEEDGVTYTTVVEQAIRSYLGAAYPELERFFKMQEEMSKLNQTKKNKRK